MRAMRLANSKQLAIKKKNKSPHRPYCVCQRGFTLLEMLAVFVIISLAIGIVYPVSFRLVEKFDIRLQRAATATEQKKNDFMRFITDETPSSQSSATPPAE